MRAAPSALVDGLAGRYDIERELGAGGMATVYLAHDVKHDRQVAVKVLRPELAAVIGAARFLAEIKVTARLQHPNILPLYDSGRSGEFLFYVMPYVEGETLRETLEREKQLGVDDAIDIAKAVAAALGHAHSRGVIHRDLKPENILLHSGQAQVADFGIALAVSHAGGSRLTETGLSLGTPQYMSPEQAAGDRDLDARSDVYALGCVVYEMLVGDPPHVGSNAQAIVAKILSEKPAAVSSTRDTVPCHVEAAVLTALAKTPADRFPTAARFVEALSDPAFGIAAPGPVGVSVGPWRRAFVVGWVAGTVALAVLAVWGWIRPQPAMPVVRGQLVLPQGQRLAASGGGAYPLDLSRDGTHLVYLGEQDGVRRLFLRPLDASSSRTLPGTEGARQPFFSPDGEWIGFFADNQLQRVAVSGGAPIPIAPLPAGRTAGASWGADDVILFAVERGLYRVSGAGGEVEQIDVTPAPETAERRSDDSTVMFVAGTMRWPHLLPDGSHALVTVSQGTGVLDLRTGELRHLFAGVQARYLPTGHLMFNAGQERVRLVPFDPDLLVITGPEVPALENVFRGPGGGAVQFTVSETGTLVYVTGGFERSLWVVDREGRETRIAVAPRGYRFPSVSPDGRRVAVTVDPRPSNIWIIDLQRASAIPLTTDSHNLGPTWAPDGERLAFARGGDLYWVDWRGGGQIQRVAQRPLSQYAPSWGPDDRIVVFETAPETAADLITLNLEDGTSQSLLATPADERLPSWSPDGRWIAYTSNASGADEVYVLPYPGRGPRHGVSVGGGTDARWSSDGKELFYRNGNRIMQVDVRTTPGFTASAPRELFAGSYDFAQTDNWDVGPDGRFVMVKGDPSTFRQFQVVINWFEEVRSQ